MNKFFQKIKDFFTKDYLVEGWKNRGADMTRVLFEFSDGETRELTGEAANKWWFDLYMRNNGRCVDWTGHKFTIIKK